MAVDLRVNLGGLKLRNPFVIAAADIGYHLGQIKEAEGYGAGAFITKGCIPRPDAAGLGKKPRYRLDLKRGIVTQGSVRRLSLEEAKKLVSEAKKEVKIPICANIFAMSPTEEEKELVTQAARELAQSGADFIELDTAGNTAGHWGETDKPLKPGEPRPDYWTSEISARYEHWIGEVTRSVKNAVSVPVMSKVSYSDINVLAVLRSMEKGGADIIDIGNGGGGLAPGVLDIFHPEKTREGVAFDSVVKRVPPGPTASTGESLRGIAQSQILRAAKILRTPILGCGGIMNSTHVIEAIMCGATATASCRVYMLHGFEVLREMEEGLRKFMEKQHYSSPEEFRGIFIGNREMLTHGTGTTILDAFARIDPEKCNGCGLCVKPAQCGINRRAISMVNKKAVVDDTQCSGCETCASVCPVDAVTMVVKR